MRCWVKKHTAGRPFGLLMGTREGRAAAPSGRRSALLLGGRVLGVVTRRAGRLGRVRGGPFTHLTRAGSALVGTLGGAGYL